VELYFGLSRTFLKQVFLLKKTIIKFLPLSLMLLGRSNIYNVRLFGPVAIFLFSWRRFADYFRFFSLHFPSSVLFVRFFSDLIYLPFLDFYSGFDFFLSLINYFSFIIKILISLVNYKLLFFKNYFLFLKSLSIDKFGSNDASAL